LVASKERAMEDEDFTPRHTVKGVSYWDSSMKEWILDPTPDMHEEPGPDIKKGWQPVIAKLEEE